MRSIFHAVAGLGAAALMGMTPLAAYADTTLGVYQTTDRKMDYELRLCGKDEKLLCVKLTAARGSANTKDTAKWIGKDIVANARPAGKNRWKGTAHIQGYTVDGDLKLSPGEKFVMSGCVYVVVCSDFMLIPAKG